MSGKYLLDTNIVIALFANDVAVVEQIRDADEVLIPTIVIGELYYGAEIRACQTQHRANR